MKFEVHDSNKFPRECAGCGSVIGKGETHLDQIDSCCGGCYRQLCMRCCKWIVENMPKAGQ